MKKLPEGVLRDAAGDFKRHGFTVLRAAFDSSDVVHLRRLSDAMSRDAAAILAAELGAGRDLSQHASAGKHELIVVPEASDPSLVCRYEYMIGGNPAFAAFVNQSLTPVVSAVLGAPAIPFKDKTNEKAAGGGAFGPHQDFAAYRFFPPKVHATAMVCIDPATRENGCVQFATNYREISAAQTEEVLLREGEDFLLRYYEGGSKNGDIVESVSQRFRWEAVEVAPQDIVIFDSYVPHYSETNASAAPRRAMFLTFNRAADGDFYGTYYAEKRSNYHDTKFHVSTPTLTAARQ